MSDMDYVFYRDRPEWSDVTPVEQDDGPNPVVPIAYSDKFKDALGYFRAVLRSNEHSERAFELTTSVIEVNSANYTCWHYRRILLDALQKDLREELAYAEQIGLSCPKNYQVWYHRRVVVERLRDAAQELPYTKTILGDDAKNYHAWSHRQWVLREFQLWEGELSFVDELLADDVRNNSAWCQRYFVINNSGAAAAAAAAGGLDAVRDREVAYAFKHIEAAPSNESAWNYLKGVLKGTFPLAADAAARTRAEQLALTHPAATPLLSFLLDVHEADAKACSNGGGEASLEKARELCEKLRGSVDTVRAKYWDYRLGRLRKSAWAEQ